MVLVFFLEIYLGRVVNQIRSLCYKATVDKRYNKWKRIRPPTTMRQKPQKGTTVRNLIDKQIDPFYEESIYPETIKDAYLQCKNKPEECDQWETGFIPDEEVKVFSTQLLEKETISDPVLISEPTQENFNVYQESTEKVGFAEDSSSSEEPLETTSEECFRNSTNCPDANDIQRLSLQTYLHIPALSQENCHTKQTVMTHSKECVSVMSECCNLVTNLEITESMAKKTPRPQSLNISLECPRPPIWSPRENISARCAKRHHRSPRGRCAGSSKGKIIQVLECVFTACNMPSIQHAKQAMRECVHELVCIIACTKHYLFPRIQCCFIQIITFRRAPP